MKKFFPYIAIVIVSIGFLVPTSRSFAATTTPTTIEKGKNLLSAALNSAIGLINPIAGVANQIRSNTGGEKDDGLCHFNLAGVTIQNCITEVGARIAFLILKIASWGLWLAGTGLNFVLRYTVVDMAAHVSGGQLTAATPGTSGYTEGMSGINIAWKVIRDLMNIAFIFLLVYEGIKIILGMSKDNGKGLIVGIILASLLINFSLFFTKVIIDASNIATIGFYNSILAGSSNGAVTLGGKSTNEGVSVYLNSGISASFMSALHINDFWDANTSWDTFAKNGGGNVGIIILGLAGSALFTVLSFVFFAITIMFVIRYVVLIILLVLSPLAFMGTAFPGMRKQSDEWWESLIGQCLFAPIYMIMTWVVLTLISAPGFITIGGSANWGNIFIGKNGVGQPDSISLLFNFVVIIALAIVSLTTSKGFATKGSKMIGDWTGKATAFAGRAVLGGAAAIGRNSVGVYAGNVANDEDLKERAAKGNKFAQLQLKTARGVAGSSFDARRSSLGESIAKSTGVDFGKGTIFNDKAGKGGFKGSQADREKKEEEYIKSLKPSDDHVQDVKRKLEREKDNLRVKISRDKETLNSDEFKKSEQKEKERVVKYLNSDAWKNSDDGKKASEAVKAKEVYETSQKEIDTMGVKKKELEEKQKNAVLEESKIAIKKEIADLDKEMGIKTGGIENLKQKWESRKTDFENYEKIKGAPVHARVMLEKSIESTGNNIDKKEKEIKGTTADSILKTRAALYADSLDRPGTRNKEVEDAQKEIDILDEKKAALERKKLTAPLEEKKIIENEIERIEKNLSKKAEEVSELKYSVAVATDYERVKNAARFIFAPFGTNILTQDQRRAVASKIRGSTGKPKKATKERKMELAKKTKEGTLTEEEIEETIKIAEEE